MHACRFRWAFLQVQSLKALKPPVTSRKVEEKLKSLPKTLNETYERMLNDLDDFDKPRAKSALMWLVFSARQLFIEELVDACAIDLEQGPLVDDKLEPFDIEPLLQDMVIVRPPLPPDGAVAEQTHTVMLMHASIREFLWNKTESQGGSPGAAPYFSLQHRESNIVLAQSCLTYLLCYNTYDLRHYHEEYPFRKYAWYHWEDHIETEPETCVPTIPTARLRRRARRLFAQMKQYID
jgi:hypothetical protein